MTYCVGLLLNEGMVMLSDTRTNAGLDNIATYRKMFQFEEPGERVITIVTAGSLSVTQTTIARLREAADLPDATPETSILLAPTMLKVAEIVGATLADVRREIDQKLSMAQGASATMIVAGQRKGGTMRMFLIYPEGNFIEATEDTPYLQIGEHKYGKPILDRVVKPNTTLADAQKAVLLSMDSTLRSNLSVGMPLDMCVIYRDDCRV
jgi:putative proteasome-type protease